jgi:predicted transcriptional regulator
MGPSWYHLGMALNVRLTDDAARALEALASHEKISKNEAINRAILDHAARRGQSAEVRRLARQAMEDYGPLLDRLSR